MKRFLLALVLYCFSVALSAFPIDFPNSVWSSNQIPDCWGFRDKMAERGLYFLPTYCQDLTWNVSGGVKASPEPTFQFLLNCSFGTDLHKLIGLDGSYAFINFLVHGGQNPGRALVGSYQPIDNMSAFPLVQIDQLWWQQDMLNRKLSLVLGKIDCYSNFGYTKYAQVLLNGSYTEIPTIMGYPSYPLAAVGIILTWLPNPWLKLKTAVFDGSSAQGVRTGNLGPRLFFQNLGKHLLLLNEIDFSWRVLKEEYSGQCLLGLWGYNGKLPTLENQTMGKAIGPYVCLSQSLYRACRSPVMDKMSELGAFLQWGCINPHLMGSKQYLAGGLTLTNLLRKFISDSLSVGAATVFFSRVPGATFNKAAETSLEATYLIKIAPRCSIQPDIQWVLHPSGRERNALAFTLRLWVSI